MDEGCKRFQGWLLERRDLTWYFPTGSFFEQPLRLIISHLTDIDILVSPTDLFAIPPGEKVPSCSRRKPRVLTICTNNVHAGFANLTYDNKKGRQFFRRSLLDREKKSDDETYEIKVRGPAVTKILNFLVDKEATQLLENLSQYEASWKHMAQLKIDEVEAIHCPCWPPEAAEWVTRKRENSWPSSSDIDKVVNNGCHFVAKPHQSNPNDATQWRFSFSQAELILIHSWTDVQKLIYHLLRLAKSEVVKNCGGEDSTVLCTYFFKTLMLWMCEEKPREFWEEVNLETSVVELIATMVEWLIDRRCPNYFIPSNNMIDYLSDGIDFSKEIEFLLHQGENCVHSLLRKIPKTRAEDQISISFSSKVIFALLMRLFIFKNVINPLDPNMKTRVLNYLTSSEELSSNIKDLYLGIVSHRKMVISRDKCLLKIDELKLAIAVLGYLEKAMAYNFSGNTDITVSSSNTMFSLVENMMGGENSKPTFCSSIENVMKSDIHSDSQSIIIQIILARFAKDFDDYFPAPLYVVSAAYRANFLFTTLMDYKAALNQSVEVMNSRICNETLLKDTTTDFLAFPLIITNEWSPIFDEHVQTVLGFVYLFRKISHEHPFGTEFRVHGDERNVVLRLCTEEFLYYIKHRCQRRLDVHIDDPLELRLMEDLTLDPMFSETHLLKFSASFLYAASRISFESDLAFSRNRND